MYLKNQSRKQKKRGMVCIVTLMLALSFGGCGDKEKKANTTTVTKENETTTVSQEETGQSESEFDFSQVYDNIELNGKKIPFPFTLNDLGDEYDFKWDVVDMGDGVYSGDLAVNGESIALVYMYGESADSINRDTLIISFSIFRSKKQEINIKGINCNSSVEDIESMFKNIHVQYDTDNQICRYWASNKNGKLFEISVDKSEITTITIQKEEK